MPSGVTPVTTVRADSKRRRNEQIIAGLLVTLPRLERKGLSKAVPMKLFKAFRLDTANHLLWRNGERVPLAPKGFDVLVYLVEHAGRVVTQDDVLGAVWPETYVNPEVLRKYIMEIRKALG